MAQSVKGTSSVVVASSSNPSATGQVVTFTATVTPSAATGSVQFLDDATVIGTVAVASGIAAFSTSSLTQGSHSITVSYSGDSSYQGATSTAVAQTVKGTSSVIVASSANPSVTGQAVTFTATVTPSAASGNVQFLDGATVIGTVAVASGVAAFSTSSLTQGSHSINASYSGDSSYQGATSTAVAQTVKGTSSVVVASSANPSVTGQAVTFTATVT